MPTHLVVRQSEAELKKKYCIFILMLSAFLTGCVAVEHGDAIPPVSGQVSAIASMSPIKVVRQKADTATLRVTIQNSSSSTICAGGLSPFAAKLANGTPVSDMFATVHGVDGGDLIVIWPGREYVWKDTFVFDSESTEDTGVMGGTEEQDLAAKEALAKGLAEGVVDFVAQTPVFTCEIDGSDSPPANGYRMVRFEAATRLSQTVHLTGATVRLDGFR